MQALFWLSIAARYRYARRLLHKSGIAARRCLILQPRRDDAAGADADLAPRRALRGASAIHVGVLYHAAD
jgi:hypothetical protein